MVSSLIPVVTLGVEDLRGKVRGLEQGLQTEGYAFEGLNEMVVGLKEKMDSSLGTAVTSQINTSGPVSVGRVNLHLHLHLPYNLHLKLVRNLC